MSVIRQDDEMMMFVNELESKVLILIEHFSAIRFRDEKPYYMI